MAQSVEISEAGKQTAVTLCDRCDADNRKPATFHYLWDWGEQGNACSEHAQQLQQTAISLNRNVSLHPLQPSAAAPLERDERTKLKASALVLEEEVNEAKARGLELYRVNTQLRGDVQLLKTRNAEAEAQLRDSRAEIEKLAAEVAKRDAEHGQLVMEIDRLKTLVSFSPSDRRELGLTDDESRVGG